MPLCPGPEVLLVPRRLTTTLTGRPGFRPEHDSPSCDDVISPCESELFTAPVLLDNKIESGAEMIEIYKKVKAWDLKHSHSTNIFSG